MNHTKKDIKFMKTAKVFAEEFVTCLSPHKVGCVIVKDGQVVGQGVNGPPKRILHIEDSYVKIDENTAVMGKGWFYSSRLDKWVKILEPKVINLKHTEDFDIKKYINIHGDINYAEGYIIGKGSLGQILLEDYKSYKNINTQRLVNFKNKDDQKGEIVKVIKDLSCPRYIVGMKSGEGLSICSCRHGESNAIFAAGEKCKGADIYCYCGLPCVDCAGDIIHAGIKRVFCLDRSPDYSYQSRSWLNQAGIEIIEISESEIHINNA